MKVWYRFPDLNIWEQVNDNFIDRTNHQLLHVIAEKNPETVKKLWEWFNTTMSKLPELNLETHRNYERDCIKCAMWFDLPEKDAIMFKLKFGNGYED